MVRYTGDDQHPHTHTGRDRDDHTGTGKNWANSAVRLSVYDPAAVPSPAQELKTPGLSGWAIATAVLSLVAVMLLLVVSNEHRARIDQPGAVDVLPIPAVHGQPWDLAPPLLQPVSMPVGTSLSALLQDETDDQPLEARAPRPHRNAGRQPGSRGAVASSGSHPADR